MKSLIIEQARSRLSVYRLFFFAKFAGVQNFLRYARSLMNPLRRSQTKVSLRNGISPRNMSVSDLIVRSRFNTRHVTGEM